MPFAFSLKIFVCFLQIEIQSSISLKNSFSLAQIDNTRFSFFIRLFRLRQSVVLENSFIHPLIYFFLVSGKLIKDFAFIFLL